MKAFVYSKKDSSTIAVFENVCEVKITAVGEKLLIITDVCVYHEFDAKKVKTTIYQN